MNLTAWTPNLLTSDMIALTSALVTVPQNARMGAAFAIIESVSTGVISNWTGADIQIGRGNSFASACIKFRNHGVAAGGSHREADLNTRDGLQAYEVAAAALTDVVRVIEARAQQVAA